MVANSNNTSGFDSEACRAQKGAGDLVECLAPKQASLCGYALSFGYGYFCKHPRRDEIIEKTKSLQRKPNIPLNISGLKN